MLVETPQAAPNLRPGDVVLVAFDDVLTNVLALINILVGCAAVHSASHICSLMSEAPVVDLLYLSGFQCVVNYAFEKYLSIRLEFQPSFGFDDPAHTRARIAEVVQDRIAPDRKILKG